MTQKFLTLRLPIREALDLNKAYEGDFVDFETAQNLVDAGHKYILPNGDAFEFLPGEFKITTEDDGQPEAEDHIDEDDEEACW